MKEVGGLGGGGPQRSISEEVSTESREDSGIIGLESPEGVLQTTAIRKPKT